MLNIALVNMPFFSAYSGSIALAQLRTTVLECCASDVTVDVCYLNHGFAQHIGLELYERIAEEQIFLYTGLGDWLFRHIAFPWAEDNQQTYFKRFFADRSPETAKFRNEILEKRRRLSNLLDELIDTYHLDRARIVGMTSMFTQNVPSLALAQRLKERRGDKVITVMGGANCEAPMGCVLAEFAPQVDYVFSGPSLRSFHEFVSYQAKGDLEACERIPGVFTRRNVAEKRDGKSTIGLDVDINKPIHLDYTHFRASLRALLPEAYEGHTLPFETSRGCWWGERSHCTFCGLNGQTIAYRAMAPERALKQIQDVLESYPDCKRLACVDNIMPKNYVAEVFAVLKTPPDVSIFYEVKPDLSSAEIGVLARAGVRVVQPGIEALATSTLKLMRKGATAPGNVRFLRDCKIHSIHAVWNLLIGFPGEQADVYKSYLRVLPHLVHLVPPSGVFPVRFDRYSPYFNEAVRYQLDLKPLDCYGLIYPFERERLADLAYFFKDESFADYAVAAAEWRGPLAEMVDKWISLWARGKVPPELRFTEDDGGTIFDSRSGTGVHYDVGPRARRILELCDRPQKLWHLKSPDSGLDDFDEERDLGHLYERNLLFKESETVVSMVCQRVV
jgi:magnesium-protoporphyrin IX monomethyl ester (oxidative) cyclase